MSEATLTDLSAPYELRLAQPEPDTITVSLHGDWKKLSHLPSTAEVVQALQESHTEFKRLVFDSEKLVDWDSRLLSFLRSVSAICQERNVHIEDGALPEGARRLLRLASAVPEKDTQRGQAEKPSLFDRVGTAVLAAGQSTAESLSFLGEAFLSFGRLFQGKARFRRSDLSVLIQEAGAEAFGIVSLINFLMGLILAFVGVIQLRRFGATIYVADLVAISMTREMAAIMTAIVVAGRSGAAYAAQLGTMMVNEEIDALKTMGFPAMDFLVLPRIIALALMMPLLTLYAGFLGILGGAFVGAGMLDLSWTQYFEETRHALNLRHIALGIIKGSIYGVLVAVAGCLRGMQSGRSASAVGAAATSAVVTGIVLIILACAITTILFDILGV